MQKKVSAFLFTLVLLIGSCGGSSKVPIGNLPSCSDLFTAEEKAAFQAAVRSAQSDPMLTAYRAFTTQNEVALAAAERLPGFGSWVNDLPIDPPPAPVSVTETVWNGKTWPLATTFVADTFVLRFPGGEVLRRTGALGATVGLEVTSPVGWTYVSSFQQGNTQLDYAHIALGGFSATVGKNVAMGGDYMYDHKTPAYTYGQEWSDENPPRFIERGTISAPGHNLKFEVGSSCDHYPQCRFYSQVEINGHTRYKKSVNTGTQWFATSSDVCQLSDVLALVRNFPVAAPVKVYLLWVGGVPRVIAQTGAKPILLY